MFQPFQLKTGGGIAAAVEKILWGEHVFTDPAQCFPWYSAPWLNVGNAFIRAPFM